MTRPTKERLEEIRCKINEDSKYLNFVMSYEDGKMILAEIDALGAEKTKMTDHFFENQRHLSEQLVEAKLERDRQKKRVAKLRECVKHYSCQGCQDGDLSARCYAYKSCITLAADDEPVR